MKVNRCRIRIERIAFFSLILTFQWIARTSAMEWSTYWPQPGAGSIYAATTWNDGTILAVGQYGLILRGNPQDWRSLESGTMYDLIDICGTESSNTYAAGSAGTLLKYTDNGWLTINTGLTDLLQAVTWDETGGVWFGGSNLFFYDGSDVMVKSTKSVQHLLTAPGNEVWVAGIDQFGYFKDRIWTEVEPPVAGAEITQMCLDQNGHIWCFSGLDIYWREEIQWQFFSSIPQASVPDSSTAGPYEALIFPDGKIWTAFDFNLVGIGAYDMLIELSADGIVSLRASQYWSSYSLAAINTTGYYFSQGMIYRENGSGFVNDESHFDWGGFDRAYYGTSAFFSSSNRIWLNHYRQIGRWPVIHTDSFEWPWMWADLLPGDPVVDMAEPIRGTIVMLASQYSGDGSNVKLYRGAPNTGWEELALPEGGHSARFIAASSADEIWIAWENIIYHRISESLWIQESVDLTGYITDLTVNPNGILYCVTRNGEAAERDETGAWRKWDLGEHFLFNAVIWDASTETAWAVGEDTGSSARTGVVFSYSGGIWNPISLPWTVSRLTSATISPEGTLFLAGDDPWIYERSGDLWERNPVASHQTKWIGTSPEGNLFLVSAEPAIWTGFDIFSKKDDSVRLSLIQAGDCYPEGSDVWLRVRAIAGNGVVHHGRLKAFICIENSFFFFPDWTEQNTGIPVVVDPSQPLEHDLIRFTMPAHVPLTQVEILVYLENESGGLLGNITRKAFTVGDK